MSLDLACRNRIVVTGAGGEYGRLTVEKLIQHTQPSSLILVTDKSPTFLHAFAAQGCVVRQCSANDPVEELALAFTGGHTLLLIPEIHGPRVEQQHAAVSAAIKANIEHLVFISVIGADQDFPTASVAQESKAIEHRIQNEPLHWTILRDSQYSETLSDASGPRVLQTQICICNIGDGRIAFVCREDSAACAAAVLRDPEMHRQRIYQLTGPELLSIRDVLDILEDLECLERGAIRHGKVTDDQMADFLERFGIPRQRELPGSASCGLFSIPDMISFGQACRFGQMAVRTDDVELLTGNAPRSMREVFWRRRSWRNDFPWKMRDLETDLARSGIS